MSVWHSTLCDCIYIFVSRQLCLMQLSQYLYCIPRDSVHITGSDKNPCICQPCSFQKAVPCSLDIQTAPQLRLLTELFLHKSSQQGTGSKPARTQIQNQYGHSAASSPIYCTRMSVPPVIPWISSSHSSNNASSCGVASP